MAKKICNVFWFVCLCLIFSFTIHAKSINNSHLNKRYFWQPSKWIEPMTNNELVRLTDSDFKAYPTIFKRGLNDIYYNSHNSRQAMSKKDHPWLLWTTGGRG